MDARRLDRKTLTELRKRAVMSVQEGESPEVVARVLQVSRQAMYGWLARYRKGDGTISMPGDGEDALQSSMLLP
jgi:transposase